MNKPLPCALDYTANTLTGGALAYRGWRDRPGSTSQEVGRLVSSSWVFIFLLSRRAGCCRCRVAATSQVYRRDFIRRERGRQPTSRCAFSQQLAYLGSSFRNADFPHGFLDGAPVLCYDARAISSRELPRWLLFGRRSSLGATKELPRCNEGVPSTFFGRRSSLGDLNTPKELPRRRRSSFVQKVGNEGAPSTNVIF